MSSTFLEALPDLTRSYLRAGGSGDGYGDAGLEIRLDDWAAMFRPTRFRDGWIDFGFGRDHLDVPDRALIGAVDAFVATQKDLAEAIPHTILPSIPMLRESFEGFPTEPVLQGIGAPEDLFGLLHPYVVHANRVEHRARYVVGAIFFTDWDDNIGLGFLFHEGRVIAAGEAQLADTTWMAQQAIDGVLTLENAYWLPER